MSFNNFGGPSTAATTRRTADLRMRPPACHVPPGPPDALMIRAWPIAGSRDKLHVSGTSL